MAKKKEGLLGTGMTATAIAGAAAGYFLYGPKGAQNRLKVRAWTLKAKAEVLEQFERAREITDDSYGAIVDKVTAKYAKAKTVGEEEAMKLNTELKKHWKAIKKAASTQPARKGKKK